MKIDPAQEFPGNIPSLYFYPFNTLVFKLNPCRILHQKNSFHLNFLSFYLKRSTPLFRRGDLRCKRIFIFCTKFVIR